MKLNNLWIGYFCVMMARPTWRQRLSYMWRMFRNKPFRRLTLDKIKEAEYRD